MSDVGGAGGDEGTTVNCVRGILGSGSGCVCCDVSSGSGVGVMSGGGDNGNVGESVGDVNGVFEC